MARIDLHKKLSGTSKLFGGKGGVSNGHISYFAVRSKLVLLVVSRRPMLDTFVQLLSLSIQISQ